MIYHLAQHRFTTDFGTISRSPEEYPSRDTALVALAQCRSGKVYSRASFYADPILIAHKDIFGTETFK